MSNGFSHDPLEPFHAALSGALARAPIPSPDQTAPQRPPVTQGVDQMVHEVFGLGTGRSVPSDMLPMLYGTRMSQPTDYTDPSIAVPEGLELPAHTNIVRGMRYLGRAMWASTFKGPLGPLSPGTGMKMAMQQGKLAPPHGKFEETLLTIAPMLVQMGVFLPLGAAGAAGEAVGAGEGLVGPALQMGAKSALQGAIASPILSAIDMGAGGASLGDIVKAAPKQALFGGAISGTLGFGGALMYRAFKLYFGDVPMTPAKQAQVAAAMESSPTGMPPDWVPGPGTVINGMRYEAGKGGKESWRWVEGDKKGQFAAKSDWPTDADKKNFYNNFLVNAQNKAAASPEGQQLEQKVEQTDPADIRSLPPTLRSHAQEVQTIGAMYIRSMGGRLAKLADTENGKMLLQRKLQWLQSQAWDPTNESGYQMSAAGQIAAIENALKQQQTLASANLLPIETEIAAVNMVLANKSIVGEANLNRWADDISVNMKLPELGKRVREMSSPDYKFPERYHDQILERANRHNAISNRGINVGSSVLYQGKLMQVIDDPEWGLLKLRSLEEGALSRDPIMAETGQVQLLPPPGAMVKGTDGKIYEIKSQDAAQKTVAATPVGDTQVHIIPLDKIAETGEHPTMMRQFDYESKVKAKAVEEAALEPIPPTKVTTKQGETGTAIAASKSKIKVRTKTGATKVVDRADIQRSTASGKPDLDHNAELAELTQKIADAQRKGNAMEASVLHQRQQAILNEVLSGNLPRDPDLATVTFSPGTIPDPGHKILYFRTQKPEEFENGWQEFKKGNYEDKSALLQHLEDKTRIKGIDVVTPHVLPQPIREGTPGVTEPNALYAWEAPGGGVPMEQYQSGAKDAITALQGKGVIDSYHSPVHVSPMYFSAGRIYRVPDALAKATLREPDLLGGMEQGEQTKYLRQLLTMNQHIDSDVAKAATEVRQNAVIASTAIGAHDAQSFTESETRRAQATVDAVKAQLKAEHDAVDTKKLVGQMMASIQDRDIPSRLAFEKYGVTDETRPFFHQMLAELPPSPVGALADEVNIAPSAKVDGQAAQITRRSLPTYEGGQPGTQEVFEIQPMSPSGNPLREARRTFNTPAEVEQYLRENGYTPTNYKFFNAQYVHSGTNSIVAGVGEVKGKGAAIPNISAQLRTSPKGRALATVLERVELPPEERLAPGFQKMLTPEEKAIVAKVAEAHQDAATGQVRYLEKARQYFNTSEEADAWLQSMKFQRQEGGDLSLVDSFRKLPNLEQLEKQPFSVIKKTVPVATESHLTEKGTVAGPSLKETTRNVPVLRVVERNLSLAMYDAMRLQRTIPEPMLEYARDFAKLVREKTGVAPFNKFLREQLGLMTPEDMAPNIDPKSVDPSDYKLQNAPYMKNMRVPHLHYELGPEEVGELYGTQVTNLDQAMHVGNSPLLRENPTDPSNLARGVPGMYADVLMPNDEGPSYTGLDKLALAAKQQEYWNKWSDAFHKASDQDYSDAVISKTSLGRYIPTDQIIRIVDAKEALLGKPVTIEFPGGKQMVVANDLVRPSVMKVKDMQDHAIAAAILEGRYGQYLRREPPMGFGKVEQSLGLFGSGDRLLIHQAFAGKAFEYARQLIGKGESLQGPPEAVDGLLKLYNRALWLKGETPEPLFGKPGVALDTPQAVLSALKAVDPTLEKPFRYAAYRDARSSMGDTPYGDLMAQAVSGRKSEGGLLDDYTADQLESLRSYMKMGPNVPLHQLVLEAARRGTLDPHIARIAQVFQNELGGLLWSDKKDISAQTKIIIPQTKDIGFFTEFMGVPWKFMTRHPLSRLVYNGITGANIEQAHYNQLYIKLQADLNQNSGIRLWDGSPDEKALETLLATHDDWQEAQKAGADPKYEYAFNTLDLYRDQRRYDNIRAFMQRQIKPIKINLDALRMEREANVGGAPGEKETWLLQHGINPDDLRGGFAMVNRDVPAGLRVSGEEGMGRSSYTHDDIETFIDQLKKYKTADELPQGTDPRLREIHDVWQHWGKKNYLPNIQQGSVAATIDGQLVGWGENYHDTAMMVQDLLKDGTISPGEVAQLKYVKRGDVADDILMRETERMSASQWRQLMNTFGSMIEEDGARVRDIFLKQSLPPEPTPGAPLPASAKERTAGLPSPYGLMQSMRIMTARIGRAQQQYALSKLFRMVQDGALDRGLSDVAKVPRLSDMPRLKEATLDLLHRALGSYTTADRMADQVYKLLQWSYLAPKEAAKYGYAEIKGRLMSEEPVHPLPWRDILNPDTYYQKYGARTRASNLIAFQALRKLAINPMSAVVNWLQYWQNTYPLMVESGHNPISAMGEAMRAWKDGHRLWYALTTGKEAPADLAGMANLIYDIGTGLQPSKQVAGGSMSMGDYTGSAPLSAGKTKGEYAMELAHYTAMLPFNGGEQTGRYATAIAILRRELQKAGIDPTDVAAIEKNASAANQAAMKARDMVDKTFFRYDDLGMPRAFSMLGPAGRLLFQFKPYIIQQAGYTFDMMKAAARGDPNSWMQLGSHLGVLSALGGATGLMYHPLMTYTGGLIKLLTKQDTISFLGKTFPLTPQALETMAYDRREKQRTPEEAFTDTNHYRWDDLLYYGIPGLMHLALGERIGISGQDMLPDFTDPGSFVKSQLGPTYGVYPELANLWGKYLAQRGSGRGVTGGAVGALAGRAIFGPAYGFGGTIGGLLGAGLASKTGDNPFFDFLTTSREGRGLMMQLLPAMARNAQKTWQIYRYGARMNLDGEPIHVPVGDKTEEMMSQLAGAQTINQQESQAVLSFENAQSARYSNNQETLINEIADAIKHGDDERKWKAIQRALDLGVYIPEESIQDRLHSIARDAMYTIQQRQNLMTRYTQP